MMHNPCTSEKIVDALTPKSEVLTDGLESVGNVGEGESALGARQRPLIKDSVFDRVEDGNLKRAAVHGFAITVLSQGVTFILRMGATVILARLLVPEDFGLQGMVAAVAGFVMVFRDAGLSLATVQRDVITHEQTSTLFWINVGIGVLLAALLVAVSPLLVVFFNESRLFSISAAMSLTFLLNGLAVQHQALLRRQMRFLAIAVSDSVSAAVSALVGIGLALLGYHYWALVGMAITVPLTALCCLWIAMPWKPGPPRRGTGVRQMLHFGGTVTINGLIVYLGYNVEKILLGRFWGAEALGLYGRAYQLVTLATEQLNSAVNCVAFPAYSRLQNDFERLKRAFLRGYSMVLSLSLPIVACCAVFADEIILVVLGDKWIAAIPIFRLLTPMMFGLALINPFGSFLQATGRARRSVNMALVIAPLVILGIVIGLPFGTTGVALGYSAAIISLVVPMIMWAKHGTGISVGDYWNAVKPSFVSSLGGGVAGLIVKVMVAGQMASIARLTLGMGAFAAIYCSLLFTVMRQGSLYLDFLKQFSSRRFS